MVVSDRIIEIIKARCFSETGLKDFVTDKDYNTLSDAVAKAIGYEPAKTTKSEKEAICLATSQESECAKRRRATLTPVGINSWKRMFGHLLKPDGSRYDTSPKTAKVVAEYLGCDSWEQVLENEEYLYNIYVIKRRGNNNNSVLVSSNSDKTSILISSLRKGDVIEVKSRPNKILHLKFLSATANSRWYKIIHTEGSNNLRNLDEIEIPFIQENRPLFATRLQRGGTYIDGYSAGSTQVVYSVIRIKE